MKAKIWFGLLAAMMMPLLTTQAQTPADSIDPLPTVATPALSSSATEVVKMAEAGTSDEVLLAYVQNSATPFDLSADAILYLRDIGLSSQVTAAMLDRDA
ncbi:MAG TPA: hypothetical protein VL793_03105, partial [Patescibacteria group bacterium]|nr:hypothetical protein [Patescibacteria group bacterium]